MKSTFDVLDVLGLKNIKVKLESLGGYEATVRPLSKAEAEAFSKRLIKGYADDGSLEFNVDEGLPVADEKLVMMLVDPVITIEQLATLDASKVEALATEVNAIFKEDEDDVEGN